MVQLFKKNANKIKVAALGGLNEVGKNMTVIEYKDEIIVIDAGLSFPEDEMLGVDIVIPDITYLMRNKDRIKGIFITHGHEDHIGALPYVLKKLNVPVYGSRLSISLIQVKLKEHKLNNVKLNVVTPRQIIKLANMDIEFIKMNHSIPDAYSIAVHTDQGIIFHTGDFKVDLTPIDGDVMDMHRICELSQKGVLLMLADSTNVGKPGYSMSERTVGTGLDDLFRKGCDSRIIVATFASNIHRMQQIIHLSLKYKRKVSFSGRSMENISNVARELGYLHIPDTDIINLDDISKYSNEQITIITTGSQGEPMAALARIAFSSHRKISIEPKDTFIISASPIPGNDKLISKVINELFRRGAEVIYDDLEEVHVSGHAYKEELKMIHTIVKPKYFMPVHGEYRHLKHHGDLAVDMGMPRKNVFILETGQVLELTKDSCKKDGKVRAGAVYVDGLGVGDVGNIVLKDRRNLAQDGMVIIVVTIEKETLSIVSGPDIVTRGFVYVKESEELIKVVKSLATEELTKCLDKEIIEWYVLKGNVKRTVENYIYDRTKRRPTIIPIIMEV